jgi:hypothetical protein
LYARSRTCSKATDCRNVCIVCLDYTGIYLLSQFTGGVAKTEMVLRRIVVDDKDFLIWSSKNLVLIATDKAENFLIWSSKHLVLIATDKAENFLIWSSKHLVLIATDKAENFLIWFLKKFSVFCNW